MLRIIGSILALIVILLGASFAWLNSSAVHIDLWVRDYDLGLPYVLFIALLVGWILGVLSTAGLIVRKIREVRRLRKAAKLAETEINNLRNIPIRNAH